MPLSPAQRRSRSRLAALTQWSRTTDWSARTATARAAFDARFEDQVDPDRRLPAEQRARMAEAARRAYFARLGRLSGKARARKAAGDAIP
jgi:hypothetical protein